MKNVRVYFSKKAQAKYISHLDLMRCMVRCIKKAGIPVWFTEGFNPHMYITFALPLSLGYEGECESFDIKLTDDGYSMDEILDRLKNVMPVGISVLSVSEKFMSASSIGFGEYEVNFSLKNLDDEICGFMEKFLSQESIEVEKKSKKKIKQIDIKPFMQIKKIVYDKNSCTMCVTLPAGGSGNVNPGLIQTAFENFLGHGINSIKVRRTGILTKQWEKFI